MNGNVDIGLRIEMFFARDHLQGAKKHRNAHLSLLKQRGYHNLFLSAKDDWTVNNKTVVLSIIEDRTNEVIGGARIITSDHIKKFPLYEMMISKEKNVTDFLRSKTNGNSGEVIGVWLNKKATDWQINSKIVLRTLFSSMKHFNLNYVFGLSSMAIWESLNTLGSRPVLEFGEKGQFRYTSKRIPAMVYHFESPGYIELANEEDRSILLQLTYVKHATLFEKIGPIQFQIEYNFMV